MSLPKINILPTHEVELKILNKNVRFRPYTIEEEKGLVTAMNDDNPKDIIINYISVIQNCLVDDIDFENLSLIDFITIAIYLRAKSQGESLNLTKKECIECKKTFDFEINIFRFIEKSLKCSNSFITQG